MPQEDSKLVKKEEVEDEEDGKSIASTFVNRKKKSPSSSNASLKSEPKVKKEVKKVRKEETDEDFENSSSKNSSNKPDKKGEVKKTKKEEVEMEKKKKKGGKAGDTDKDIKKRERKVFHLPGQKRDPPEERDPLRIFYETLYKQVPTSEMASIWMMESGLLSKDEAKKVFEKKQKRAQQQKLGTPTKTVVVKKKAESVTIVRKSAASPVSVQKKKTASSKVVTKQSKKRKSKDNSSEDDTDDDFEDELSVSQILLGLENLTPFPRFIWGCRKRRSCLDAAPSAPPSVQIAEEEIEVRRSLVEAGEAAAAATYSPATPLSFSPSESDGKSKRSSKKILKKRALKTRQSKEEPQRDTGRFLNLGMDFIQHDETIMLPRLQPFVADQTAHKLHHLFGPVRAQMYPPNNGLRSDNQVGPSGIPDLNLTAEEAFGVDSTQPLDVNREIADKRARFAEARRMRKGLIKVKSMRSACDIKLPRLWY